MPALMVGIGHPFRGDDGAGPLVARAVAALSLADVTVMEHHGEGTDLMARWAGFDRVVLVDATCSGAAPGSIRQWDALAGPVPATLFPKSSHQFGVGEAIALARLLGQLPPHLVVIGIEGADFTASTTLSPAVAASLPMVVEQVRTLLD